MRIGEHNEIGPVEDAVVGDAWREWLNCNIMSLYYANHINGYSQQIIPICDEEGMAHQIR